MMKNMISRFFLPVFLLLHIMPFRTFPQGKHHIGMGLGVSLYQNKDYLASPMTYRGWSPAMKLFYQYRGDRNDHGVVFSIRKSDLRASVSEAQDAHIVHHIGLSSEYRYHRLIKSWSREKARFYLGGILYLFFSRRDHLYDMDFNHIYISSISSLDLSTRLDFKISRSGTIFSQFAIPVVAIWFREPYSIKGPLAVQCTSLHRFFRFSGQWGFEWIISNRMDLDFTYELVYFQYTKPQKTSTGMDCFYVSIVIKL